MFKNVQSYYSSFWLLVGLNFGKYEIYFWKPLEKYFQNENIDKFAWIQDPLNSIVLLEFTSTKEESIIELSCDNSLKTKFGNMKLITFSISIKYEYSLPSNNAQRISVPFLTSYLHEAGFSWLVEGCPEKSFVQKGRFEPKKFGNRWSKQFTHGWSVGYIVYALSWFKKKRIKSYNTIE